MDFTGIEIDPAMATDFTVQVISGLVVAVVLGLLGLLFRRRPKQDRGEAEPQRKDPKQGWDLPERDALTQKARVAHWKKMDAARRKPQRKGEFNAPSTKAVIDAMVAGLTETQKRAVHTSAVTGGMTMAEAADAMQRLARPPDAAPEGMIRLNHHNGRREIYVHGAWHNADDPLATAARSLGAVTNTPRRPVTLRNVSGHTLALPAPVCRTLEPGASCEYANADAVWEDPRFMALMERGLLRFNVPEGQVGWAFSDAAEENPGAGPMLTREEVERRRRAFDSLGRAEDRVEVLRRKRDGKILLRDDLSPERKREIVKKLRLAGLLGATEEAEEANPEVTLVFHDDATDPHYIVIVGGKPLGAIHRTDQGLDEYAATLFNQDVFAEHVLEAVEKLGLEKTLADLSLRYYADDEAMLHWRFEERGHTHSDPSPVAPTEKPRSAAMWSNIEWTT